MYNGTSMYADDNDYPDVIPFESARQYADFQYAGRRWRVIAVNVLPKVSIECRADDGTRRAFDAPFVLSKIRVTRFFDNLKTGDLVCHRFTYGGKVYKRLWIYAGQSVALALSSSRPYLVGLLDSDMDNARVIARDVWQPGERERQQIQRLLQSEADHAPLPTLQTVASGFDRQGNPVYVVKMNR